MKIKLVHLVTMFGRGCSEEVVILSNLHFPHIGAVTICAHVCMVNVFNVTIPWLNIMVLKTCLSISNCVSDSECQLTLSQN